MRRIASTVTRYDRAMRIITLALVACSSAPPAPTCKEVAAHARTHIQATHPMSPEERTKQLDIVPFDPKLDDADERYVERVCERWTEEYRRCVLAATAAPVRCGSADADWSGLPRIGDWTALEKELANMTGLAVSRYGVAMSDASRSLAEELAATKDPAKRKALEEKQALAIEAAHASANLALRCLNRPLEQADCVEVARKQKALDHR